MDTNILSDLGISKDDLVERVIARASEELLTVLNHGDEDGEYRSESPLAKAIEKRVRKYIDDTIDRLATAHVLPKVGEMIERLTIQETNRWGERTGKALTFIEYLAQRAEAYLTEQVNFEGKGKTESSAYSWSGTQTRLTHLVHQHLHYAIEHAMKNAVGVVNEKMEAALLETAKAKLGEIAKTLSVSVKTGR